MAEITPPFVLQSGSHPASTFRQLVGSLVPFGGVVLTSGSATDLKVSQRAAGANMSVDVAQGQVVIPGTLSPQLQGHYHCATSGVTNVSVSTSHASLSRKDIVVAQVRDSQYSGSLNKFAIEVVTGIPAASPSAPAVPANSWVLATITVPAGATSIVNANIADNRVGYLQSGGYQNYLAQPVAFGPNSYKPTVGVHDGTVHVSSDNNYQIQVYSGGLWRQITHAPGGWTALSYTDGWSTYTGGPVLQYRLDRNMVQVRGRIQRAGGAPSSGSVIATLPSGYRPTIGTAYLIGGLDSSNGITRIDVTTAGAITWQTTTAGAAAAGVLTMVDFEFATN